MLVLLKTIKAYILPFFEHNFLRVWTVNVGATSIVLYSKDAEFNVDFKNDNFLQQNVNTTRDIWLFVRGYKGMSLSLWHSREDENSFSFKFK